MMNRDKIENVRANNNNRYKQIISTFQKMEHSKSLPQNRILNRQYKAKDLSYQGRTS